MTTLELKIPPLLLTAMFAAAMAGIAAVVPALDIIVPARPWLAGAFASLGATVAAAGVLAFRRHGTTVNPLAPEQSSTLVAIGIYRHTRNPMYLGFLLALAGWALWLANLAAMLPIIAFVPYLDRFQILPEERALRRTFGAGFDDYAARVRRWL